MFDQSSFAKVDVQGPGAAALLQRLCANRVDRTVGAIAYTQMLNSRGGIESDFTVTRLGERSFRTSPAPPSATTTWRGSASTCRTTAA